MQYAALPASISLGQQLQPSQVTLQQPAPAKVTESVEAVNDEALVDAGLEMFGGQGKDDEDDDDGGTIKGSQEVVKTEIAGITKGPTNHLVRGNRAEN